MAGRSGCEPRGSGCLRASSTTGTTESVTFNAISGTTYYFVVDGFGSSAGDFTLSVACP